MVVKFKKHYYLTTKNEIKKRGLRAKYIKIDKKFCKISVYAYNLRTISLWVIFPVFLIGMYSIVSALQAQNT